MKDYNIFKDLVDELTIEVKGTNIVDEHSKNAIIDALNSTDQDSKEFIAKYLSNLDFSDSKNQKFLKYLLEEELILLTLYKQENDKYLIEIKNS